ncbi:hypothetical protein PENSPDRAFT_657476 [Peniophora sp. CONT]|nr:hypothetical protein PENSPDRAFT_657476 [Peniophora sp. CONT]
MSLLNGTETQLPLWAQAILNNRERGITDGLASAGYPEQSSEEYRSLIAWRPNDFVDEWLAAYRGRSRSALRNPTLWLMTRMLATLADPIRGGVNFFEGTSERNVYISKPWENLLDAGLCVLCHEALSSGNFFDEFPIWVSDMMKVIGAIIAYLRHVSTYLEGRPRLHDAICELSAKLWECCWLHRDRFVTGNPLEQFLPGLAKELRVPLRNALRDYLLVKHDANVTQSENPVYLNSRGLILMCWFYRDDPWIDNFEMMASVPFVAILHRPSELSDFIQREVVEKHGAKSYLVRLGISIQCSDTDLPGRQRLNGTLATIRKVLRHDAFKPYLYPSGADQLQLHSQRTMIALQLLQDIVDAVPAETSTLIRELNVIRLISYGIMTLYRTLKDAETLVVMQLCDSFTNVGKELRTRSAKNPLRKAYERSLRREWYPSLKALDDMSKLPHIDSKPEARSYARLGWHRLGTVGMGLNEDNERKLYKERASKLCSWRECKWYTMEPSEQLKECTGCREARYCGTACQYRDWKNGHKQMCRRLKQTPHNKT